VAWARESFEFGLRRLLDRIEDFVKARGRPSADDQ